MKEFGEGFLLSLITNLKQVDDALTVFVWLGLTYLVVRGFRRRGSALELAAPLLLLLGYHVVISYFADPIDRYYKPILPVMAVFGAAGAYYLSVDTARPRLSRAVAMCAIAFMIFYAMRSPIRSHRAEQSEAGRWLGRYDPAYRGPVVARFPQPAFYAGMRFIGTKGDPGAMQKFLMGPDAAKYCVVERHTDEGMPWLGQSLAWLNWRMVRRFPERDLRIYQHPRWPTRDVCLPTVTSDGPAGLEVGIAFVGDGWQRVALKKRFRDPVIVAYRVGAVGRAPAVVRLRNVRRGGFGMRLQMLGGQQTGVLGTQAARAEVVYYLVAERGHRQLASGGALEAGKVRVQAARPRSQEVKFRHPFGSVPVVFCQLMSVAGAQPARTRHGAVTTKGMRVGIEEPVRADGYHPEEEVGYIAIRPGIYRFGAWLWEVRMPARAASWRASWVDTAFGRLRVKVEKSVPAEGVTPADEQFAYIAFGTPQACMAQLQTCRDTWPGRLSCLTPQMVRAAATSTPGAIPNADTGRQVRP